MSSKQILWFMFGVILLGAIIICVGRANYVPPKKCECKCECKC